jgi:hypothetical protein
LEVVRRKVNRDKPDGMDWFALSLCLDRENYKLQNTYEILVTSNEELKKRIINSNDFIDSLFAAPYHFVLSRILLQLNMSRYDFALLSNFSKERISGVLFGMFRMKLEEKLTFLSTCLESMNEEAFPKEHRVYFQLLRRLVTQKLHFL